MSLTIIKATRPSLWRFKPDAKKYDLDGEAVGFFHVLRDKFPQIDPSENRIWMVSGAVYLRVDNAYNRLYYLDEPFGQSRSAADFIAQYDIYLQEVTNYDPSQYIVSTSEQLVDSGVDIDYSSGNDIFAYADFKLRCTMVTLAHLCANIDSDVSLITDVDSIELVE